MNAGESVIEEILKAIESSGDASQTIAKFLKRYPSDIELSRASEIYGQYLASRDEKKLSEAKSRLRGLSASRSIESSGGGDIALKDRRKFVQQFREQRRE